MVERKAVRYVTTNGSIGRIVAYHRVDLLLWYTSSPSLLRRISFQSVLIDRVLERSFCQVFVVPRNRSWYTALLALVEQVQLWLSSIYWKSFNKVYLVSRWIKFSKSSGINGHTLYRMIWYILKLQLIQNKHFILNSDFYWLASNSFLK